jgi:hypothetical protein
MIRELFLLTTAARKTKPFIEGVGAVAAAPRRFRDCTIGLLTGSTGCGATEICRQATTQADWPFPTIPPEPDEKTVLLAWLEKLIGFIPSLYGSADSMRRQLLRQLGQRGAPPTFFDGANRLARKPNLIDSLCYIGRKRRADYLCGRSRHPGDIDHAFAHCASGGRPRPSHAAM